MEISCCVAPPNVKRVVVPVLVLGFFVLTHAHAAAPVMRVLKARNESYVNLLRNANFQQAPAGKLADWSPAANGCAPGEGRNGTQGLRCDGASGSGWAGASQTVNLNRTNISPILVRGWSKAENIGGSPDNDYSLYVDILYEDGTPLWGQTANFRTGTHDWQQRELLILPEKPVKSLTLHCILRRHSGIAWFDDVSVAEVKTEGDALVFEGVPIAGPGTPSKSRLAGGNAGVPGDGKPRTYATRDGLEVVLQGHVVTSLKLGGKEQSTPAPSGFLARDIAANSDLYDFSPGACPELGLKLHTECQAFSNHIVFQGRVSDARGKDRAITLVFALPIDASGWRWGDDIRRNRRVAGKGEFANTVMVRCGATGTMSLYPIAAIYNEREGLALGIDMASAAQYRLVYHPGTKQFYIAYDFGLVPETQRFPGAAEFRFVLFRFDPYWGFRAAFQEYMEIFPEHFAVRSPDQGLWMPFTDVSTVQDWQDFGFRYHEGNNNVAWDDAHGVLSFRYTEPMTWWMRMPKDVPRTPADALRIRDDLARGADRSQRRMAQVSQVAAMWTDSGEPSLLFRNEPWCNGAVWSLNPNPDLPVPSSTSGQDASDRGQPYNGATVYWNASTKNDLYGPAAKGQLDGEYLDSLEGYVTTDLNFRREHFRYTSVPLTFASDTRQPALFKGLAVFEFTKWISQEVHSLGKLMFANGVAYRFSILCPWLDVVGTETDWLSGGKYRPASDTQMSLWRTMSGRKPYLLLMNTDYETFGPEMVEKYFKRSLFYGMFPGMFSHNAADNPYWRNPKWYNRDRPLFRKYLPVIKRVAEAGWQPLTKATCDTPNILLERFGPGADGAVFITLLNDTAERQQGIVKIDLASLGLSGPAKARDLLSGEPLQRLLQWPVTLDPQDSTAIEITSGAR